MTEDNVAQPRRKSWRELAEEVLRETDHDKILALARELCDAVDEQLLQTGRVKKAGNA
jgi:hypothetical protein